MTAMNNAKSEELLRVANKLRSISFAGITVSITTILISVLVIPLLYTYIQSVHTTLMNEVEFCKQRSSNMWNEFDHIQKVFGVNKGSNREKRYTYYVSFDTPNLKPPSTQGYIRTPISVMPSVYEPTIHTRPEARPPSVEYGPQTEGCCSCGIGDAGPPGYPGKPGDNGVDGIPGENGAPGPDAVDGLNYKDQDWCFDCPIAPPGPQGVPGPKGLTGPRGADGADGNPGSRGEYGPQGLPGPKGIRGQRGEKGIQGRTGIIRDVRGVKGRPGTPGSPGLPGADGLPGDDGNPGPPGLPGPQGNPGLKGLPGKRGLQGLRGPKGLEGNHGSCDHCSKPRLEDGYALQ